MFKRLRWWKTKEDIRRIKWDANQESLAACKVDLAWALNLDKNTPWTELINQAKHRSDIYKTWRGEMP